MKRMAPARLGFVFSTAALLLAGSTWAYGQNAGFDLLQTAPGAKVDLTKLGLGVVPLKGVPIEACTGNADTIMRRTKDVPAAGGNVPLEVYALFMKSTHSIKFKGQAADLFVTINNSSGKIPGAVVPQPDALATSIGTIDVRKNHTFDSSISVAADLIFVKAGKSPGNPGNVLEHQPAPPIALTAPGSTWSSKAFLGYPRCNEFPSGDFYARPKHRGPHPVNPGTVGKPVPVPKPPQGA